MGNWNGKRSSSRRERQTRIEDRISQMAAQQQSNSRRLDLFEPSVLTEFPDRKFERLTSLARLNLSF